ncbi:hypothetical protein ACFX2F_032738 [Malus domestica]
MERGARQNMELLARKFGSNLSLLEKERGGIKIEKKDTEGALLGFHHSMVTEVLSTKAVNENGFIDQFTSLWGGNEGVSIRALGGALFMARFVGRLDMSRVLEADKPWLFQDDLVLVVDVIKAGKDDGRDYIGRFLQVKISFDVREPLMRGAIVEFPDDGKMWIDFLYEGLLNNCLICGKMGHVTRWCKEKTLGERASTEDVEAMYAFKGLDTEFDLRGNWLARRGQHVRSRLGEMHMGAKGSNGSASSSSWRRQFYGAGVIQQELQARKAEEREQQRLTCERAFDAGLIGPEVVIAPEAGPIVLEDHP